MALACKNGQIAVNEIMDAINKNETDITAIEVISNANKVDNVQQDTLISGHETRLTAMESAGSVVAMSTEIQTLQNDYATLMIDFANSVADISTNSADIFTDAANLLAEIIKIDKNIFDIASLQADVAIINSSTGELVHADALTPVTVTNQLVTEADVASQVLLLIPALIDETRYKTREQNTLTVEQRVPVNTSGGASTSGSWELRGLTNIVNNYIGGNLGLGSVITLPSGMYKVRGYVEGVGGYHQSRIYNQTDSSVAILGSSQASGKSMVNGIFTIATDSTFILETQVDTSDANGHGEPNSFDEGVFAFIEFTRIGD